MQTSSPSRQTYLDWLRIMAILGVLFFHAAMPFVAEWEWHIKNKETSNLFLEMTNWLHMFRMPLLFFISGTVSYFMLQHRSGGSFIGLRFRRLFIPILVGILIIVPPQIYLERLTQGYKGNFWQFYTEMFTTGAYPKGNLSWHHLWFIVYLLIYDILLAPVFVWIISPKGKAFLQRVCWLAIGKRVYLLTIPAILVYTAGTLKFPETNNLVEDWCYFFYWACFLLPGFLCIAQPALMDSLERNRRTSLLIGFVSLICINYMRWNHLQPWDNLADWEHDWRTYAFLALKVVCAWGWVLTGIGYGKKYLNKKHRILNYLNEAVYPFYILHQTVIIILAYYVVQTSDTLGMKYAFIVIVTFLLSMGIFHLLIRPFAVTRLLFGMKPAKKIPVAAAKNTDLTKEQEEAAVLLPVS
jgi:peptidoglycan/LPS O-acetylase OafA/YrhL